LCCRFRALRFRSLVSPPIAPGKRGAQSLLAAQPIELRTLGSAGSLDEDVELQRDASAARSPIASKVRLIASFVSRTASGAALAIARASATARSISWPSGTTWLTMPSARARSAES
jgi:hypothetical protein